MRLGRWDDLPRRGVFNDRTYPRLTRLLAELGVESQPSDMSFSVYCAKSGLEYNGSSLNTLFAQRENLVRGAFWRMLGDILRFNREAPRLLEEEGGEMGLGEYLERGGYGSQLRDYYILPRGAAIWSTDPVRMLDFPARLFVRFFVNHALLSMRDRPVWQVIRGGSRTYFERLIAPFRVHWQALRLWLKGTPIHDHPAPTPAERERTA